MKISLIETSEIELLRAELEACKRTINALEVENQNLRNVNQRYWKMLKNFMLN